MPDCWLVLSDDQVSRYHARLSYDGERGRVEDRGSRNGTYVNGQRIQARVEVQDGDQVGIGRESLLVVVTQENPANATSRGQRATVTSPLTGSFGLMGGLIEKSVQLSRFQEAERYAQAAMGQLCRKENSPEESAVEACIRAILRLAERTSSGLWLDRIFRLYAMQTWVMSDALINQVRRTLDRIPRVPGTGLADYELALRTMIGSGVEVRPELVAVVAELSDTFGQHEA